MTDETAIETEIQAKGLTAPRVTPEHITAQIVGEAYYVFPGHHADRVRAHAAQRLPGVGHSACASPENFDEALGRKIARDNARGQIWALEGYQLRSFLMHADRARGRRL